MFVGDLLRDLAVLASGDRWHEDTVRGTCRRQVLPGHQFALVPIIGRSFDRSYVYIGGGPTLSLTRGKFNSLVGFARIFGERADISGPPTDLSSSNWMWAARARLARLGSSTAPGSLMSIIPIQTRANRPASISPHSLIPTRRLTRRPAW